MPHFLTICFLTKGHLKSRKKCGSREEFEKAFLDYDLSYLELKAFSRNSITYSFLGGENLWSDSKKFIPQKECLSTQLGGNSPSLACENF